MAEARRIKGWVLLLAMVGFVAAVAAVILLGPRRS
jgi:hypothetical protein